MAHLNKLYGPNAIEQLMEKKEFSCIRRTYFLLYQSLIPNCKMTITILRQHCEITSDVEQYILNRGSARLRCQQLLNFLLVRLDKSKDYMEFCKFLQLTSVLHNLSTKMISEFQKCRFWCFKAQHDVSRGIKYDVRLQAKPEFVPYQTMYCDTDEAIAFHCLSARYCEASEAKENINSDILISRRLIKRFCKPRMNLVSSTPPSHKEKRKIKEEVATTNISISPSNTESADSGIFFNETFQKLTLPSNSKGIALLEKHYSSFCHCLPKDNMITVTRSMHVTDESIAHLSNPKIINERIVADMIIQIKSEEELLDFCDQFEHLVDPASRAFVEKFRDEVLTMLTTSDDSAQSLPVNSTPKIQPQDNSQSNISAVTTVQPTSGDATSCEVTLDHFRADSERNRRPTLRDVQRHVIPNYAHKWRHLGTQLEFSEAELEIIFSNFRNDSEKCCRDLVSRWLSKNPNATWDQLLTAINNLPQQSTISEFTSTAMKFQQPPVLPPNYIPRDKLLKELVSAVMTTELEPNRFGCTVTITGVGGFGKSVLAKALCHHDTIKAKFKSGFIFVELGPKTFDPVVELHQLYYLLTGKEFPASQSNTTNIVKELRQITINHSDKLLVIIDDVWHVEGAEPIVEAFSNCKTIITTRKNEIVEQIPSKYSITAGPMEPLEAISLLIDGVLQTQLSENDHTSLNNIAHDVHLWPLLLSLVRGQLSHYYNRQKMSFNAGVKMIHQKLYANGLTVFDKNNIGSNVGNRKYAVKACIETTLDLLQKSDSDKMKAITLFSGIGSTIPKFILHVMWKTSHPEADDTVSILWGHGLLTYGSSVVVPCFGIEQCHIEVHAIISQYIMETMQTEEIMQLTPYLDFDVFLYFAGNALEELCRYYDLSEVVSLSDKECLLGIMEYFTIPYLLRYVNMWAVVDPHLFRCTVLQRMLEMFTEISCIDFDLSAVVSSFSRQIKALINDCQKVIIDICRSKKSLYQLSMKHLVERNYDGLLQELDNYQKQYPMGAIVEKTVKSMDGFLVYCQDYHEIHSMFTELFAALKLITRPNHFNVVIFPAIGVFIDLCKRIKSSNLTEINQPAEYFSRKMEEDLELIKHNYLLHIQEVSPNIMNELETWLHD